MIRGTVRKVHFVGIGGTGMCGLAEILLTLGYEVSGSDLATDTEAITRLVSIGAHVSQGHASEHISGADLVVVSSAVGEQNPEVREAHAVGLPVLKRGQMLAEIMRLKYGVAVAGSHGKTTTTSLVGQVLSEAGRDPTLFVGGRLRSIGSNARVGSGEIFVAEADESDGSFLEILPTVAVVTNIDREHLDHYRNFDAIKAAFLRFASSVPFYGAAVLCGDDPGVRAIVAQINRPMILYGFAPDCQVRAEKARSDGEHSRFHLRVEERGFGEFRIPLPGRHNIQNALAAIAASLFLNVPPDEIRAALDRFEGVSRRFEIRSRVGGVVHLDDYGHHPTEIRAVLRAAREVFDTRRLVVFFQPHRYTRTAALHEEFAGAFEDADLVVLTEIYAAGEVPIQGVTAELLRSQITMGSHVEVVYARTEDEAVKAVAERLEGGDVLLTLGAGPIWKWGEAAMRRWRNLGSRRQGSSVGGV